MRDSLESGAKGELLVGVDLPTHPDAIAVLLTVQREFASQFSLKYFRSPAAKWFHPKLYIFVPRRGRRRALVGSSNMTAGGLKNNYEASFWSDEPAATTKLAEYFEELHNGGHARAITDEWLMLYRRLWQERQRQQHEAEKTRKKVRSIQPDSATRKLPRRIKGYKFVFTGGISGWPRERKLYPRVRRLGGLIGLKAGALSTSDFLVHGDRLEGKRATVKLKAARDLGVPIISEEEFLGVLSRA